MTAIQKRELPAAIAAAKDNFAGRLPAGMEVDKFVLGIQTAVQKNPDLLLCDRQSVLLAAYDAAELGISLSPALALGWLIPYKTQCVFQVSYRGLIQKAYETKAVRTFFAEVVYEKDSFTRQFAPKRNLFHAPADGDRGEKIGAYAFIEFVDGTTDWEYLTTEQIERRRKHSRNPDSLMWTKFWEEGYRKTPIRVLWKRIPLSNPGMERLAEQVAKEQEIENDEPSGRLELDADSPIAPQPEQVNAVPAAAIPPAPKVTDILFYVGEKETVITGDVRKILEDLPEVGAKLHKRGNSWTMPSARTHELLSRMDKKNISYREVDENGSVIESESLFEDR
jgi:recombination protein RecT